MADDLQRPRLLAHRYRLEREVARGGMGSVFVGRDEKLGRAIAVKVLSTDLAQIDAARARFEREARVLAKLRSTHVVEVYDFGIEKGLPYIVMELLEGESLAERLKRSRRMSLAEAVAVLVQVCKGLEIAHQAALIHRDLKPSNIFVAQRDGGEVIKLLDFGVVKINDPEIAGGDATVTGILVGTPQYMSPEQARATREIDPRSDLWSAGVILFRMLAGRNPFRGESVGDVVLRICSDELPRIHDFRPELPAELDAFFARALARHPDGRFQSAAVMARAVVSLLPSSEGARTSLPGILPAEVGLAREATPSLTDASGPSGLPFHAYEPTPTPSTVGGTQLPLPPFDVTPRPSRQPLAVVIGAVATLVVVSFVAMLWLGSEGEPGHEGSSPRLPAAPAAPISVEEPDELEEPSIEASEPTSEPSSDPLDEEAKAPEAKAADAKAADAKAADAKAAEKKAAEAKEADASSSKRDPKSKTPPPETADTPKWF